MRLDGPPLFIGEVGEPDTQVKLVFSTPGTDEWPEPRASQPRRRQWVPDTFGSTSSDAAYGADFFVVVRASSKVDEEDDFRVGIVGWGPNTPTEPDPDTFTDSTSATQSVDEFDIFSEFPWGARGLGFVTFFADPPTYYWMDGTVAKQRTDNSGFNWVRSSSTVKKETNVITASETGSSPYALVISSITPSVLPVEIADDQEYHVYIEGSGFGTDPSVVISGYTTTIFSATDDTIGVTVTNTEGVTPTSPVVVIVRNPDTEAEQSRDDLLTTSTDASQSVPYITNVIPDHGSSADFPVTITGQYFNTDKDTVRVYFGETRMPIEDIMSDGTSITVNFPDSNLPQTGLLDVTVRNYSEGSTTQYSQDTRTDGFDYENAPEGTTCAGGSLKRPAPPSAGAGDLLVLALAASILALRAKRPRGLRTVLASCRRLAVPVVLVGVGLGLALPAYGFFPIGGFGEYTGELNVARWPLHYMDVNGDGDVSGPEEGVEVTIESGSNGFSFRGDQHRSGCLSGVAEHSDLVCGLHVHEHGVGSV